MYYLFNYYHSLSKMEKKKRKHTSFSPSFTHVQSNLLPVFHRIAAKGGGKGRRGKRRNSATFFFCLSDGGEQGLAEAG